MNPKDYSHVRCACGGHVGMYERNSSDCVCDSCGKIFSLHSLKYDELAINSKTGWIFPMIKKPKKTFRQMTEGLY